MTRQNDFAILRKNLIASLHLLLALCASTISFSQTIDYSTSGITPNNCNVFNVNPQVKVGTYLHYTYIGGAGFNTSTYLNLQTAYQDYFDVSGTEHVINQGTAYSIQFPFKATYSYSIKFVVDQGGGAYGAFLPQLEIGLADGPTGPTNKCGADDGVQYIPYVASVPIGPSSFSTITMPTFTAPANATYLVVVAAPGIIGQSAQLIDGDINIKSITITGTAPQPACSLAAPTGLTTTNNTQTLTWTSETGANSYNLSITDTHNGVPTTTQTTSTTNSYSFCAQGAGDNVSYTVQGVCSNGSGGTVSTAYAFTASAPVPQNVAYNTVSNALSWTAVAGAAGYNVQLTDITANTAPVVYAASGSAMSANSLNLISEHNYQASVSAITCYSGAYSSPITFTVPCLYSTIGTTEQTGQYSPVWVFYEQVNTALSYSIQFTNTVTQATTTQSNLAYNGNGYQFSIAPGTYTVAIQTVNSACTSPYEPYGSNVITVIASPPPGCTPAPSFATVQGVGSSIKVYWNNTSGATSYNFKFSNLTTGGTATVSHIAYSSGGYTYNGVAGDTYQVYIQSNCSAGTSDWIPYSTTVVASVTGDMVSGNSPEIISQNGTDQSRFKIFPVPSSGTLNIIHNADEAGGGDISVVNALGTTLMVKHVGITAGQNRYTFDVSNFPNGVYIVKLFNGKQIFLQKLVVQK